MVNVIEFLGLLGLTLAAGAYYLGKLWKAQYWRGRSDGTQHGYDLGVADAYHHSLTMTQRRFHDWCER